MLLRMSNKQKRLIVANSVLDALVEEGPNDSLVESIKWKVYDAVMDEYREGNLDNLDKTAVETIDLIESVIYEAVSEYMTKINKPRKVATKKRKTTRKHK
jgi:hypothetical protein